MARNNTTNIIKLILIMVIIGVLISLIGAYIKGMKVNVNEKADIKVTSNFLQMQLEDPIVNSERNFIGKFHFEVKMPEDTFKAKKETKSRFVKKWFKDRTEVMILSEKNKFVSGDFDFLNSKGYEGDDYKKYKESFKSEIYFNQNNYKLNIPWEAIGENGKIKEDYQFNFVITVQTVRMSSEDFISKNGVIILRDFIFNFKIINNGIIKFDEEETGEVKLGSSQTINFREFGFGNGKVVEPYKGPWQSMVDMVNKILKN